MNARILATHRALLALATALTFAAAPACKGEPAPAPEASTAAPAAASDAPASAPKAPAAASDAPATAPTAPAPAPDAPAAAPTAPAAAATAPDPKALAHLTALGDAAALVFVARPGRVESLRAALAPLVREALERSGAPGALTRVASEPLDLRALLAPALGGAAAAALADVTLATCALGETTGDVTTWGPGVIGAVVTDAPVDAGLGDVRGRCRVDGLSLDGVGLFATAAGLAPIADTTAWRSADGGVVVVARELPGGVAVAVSLAPNASPRDDAAVAHALAALTNPVPPAVATPAMRALSADDLAVGALVRGAAADRLGAWVGLAETADAVAHDAIPGAERLRAAAMGVYYAGGALRVFPGVPHEFEDVATVAHAEGDRLVVTQVFSATAYGERALAAALTEGPAPPRLSGVADPVVSASGRFDAAAVDAVAAAEVGRRPRLSLDAVAMAGVWGYVPLLSRPMSAHAVTRAAAPDQGFSAISVLSGAAPGDLTVGRVWSDPTAMPEATDGLHREVLDYESGRLEVVRPTPASGAQPVSEPLPWDADTLARWSLDVGRAGDLLGFPAQVRLAGHLEGAAARSGPTLTVRWSLSPSAIGQVRPPQAAAAAPWTPAADPAPAARCLEDAARRFLDVARTASLGDAPHRVLLEGAHAVARPCADATASQRDRGEGMAWAARLLVAHAADRGGDRAAAVSALEGACGQRVLPAACEVLERLRAAPSAVDEGAADPAAAADPPDDGPRTLDALLAGGDGAVEPPAGGGDGATAAADPELTRRLTFRGFCDEAGVTAVLDRRLGSLRDCFTEVGAATGEVVIGYAVGLDGATQRVGVRTDTTGVPGAGECIARHLRRARHPRPEGGVCVVEATISLL